MAGTNAIKSMTGFGRAEANGQDKDGFSARVEIKTVNARGLEIKLKLPGYLDRLDPILRKNISRHLNRGHVQVNMQIDDTQNGAVYVLNAAQLDFTLDAIGTAAAAAKSRRLEISEKIELTALLDMPGMMVPQRPAADQTKEKAREKALTDLVDEALGALVKAREVEGAQIVGFLRDQLTAMANLRTKIDGLPARQPEAIRQKFRSQFCALIDDMQGLEPERLHQEASLLALKADVREELDRLSAHVENANTLLEGDGPIGRKLDFLAQELNREANTLCAKSNDVGMTQLGVELKSLVDQFREQVQNLE